MDILSPISDFEEIVRRVANGEVFLYPTDTVAGIGCDATNETSVAKIFNIKSRDSNKSVSFAFSSIEHMREYVELSEKWDSLLSLFPGGLTLVLNQKAGAPKLHGISTPTIGARIPDVPWLLKLITRLKVPVVTTSANISGEQPASNFDQTSRTILNGVDFAIPWDGELAGKPSTVISLVDDAVLLREGKISKDTLNELIGTKTF